MPGGLLSLISRRLLLCALVLAVPAYFQAIAWFQPIDQRLELRGVNAGWTFVLESPQSLFLEVAVTVREAQSSQSRVVFELNGSRLSEVTPTRLYVADRFRVLLPAATTRPGENRLAVQLADSQASTFELEARLHNYYGTNPKFPRAFIVSDDAVAYWFGQQSLLQHAVRLSACYLASVMLLVGLAWIPGPVSAWRSSVLLVSPSIVLWIALLFGLATPLHMWLTIESVLVLSIVPGVLVAVALSLRWRPGLIAEIVGVTAVTCVLFELSLRAFNHFRPSWVFYSDSVRPVSRPGRCALLRPTTEFQGLQRCRAHSRERGGRRLQNPCDRRLVRLRRRAVSGEFSDPPGGRAARHDPRRGRQDGHRGGGPAGLPVSSRE